MKRILSVFLVLSLFCCMAFPVNASGLDVGTTVDLLDYGFSNETNSNFRNFTQSGTMTYYLPSASLVSYIDCSINFNGAPLLSVELWRSGNKFSNLTLQHISGYSYRVYGSFSVSNFTEISLKFISNSSSYSYVTIESLRIGLFGSDVVNVEGYCNIVAPDYESTIHYVPTDEINYRSFFASAEWPTFTYNLYLWSDDWRKFDYLDFYLYTAVNSINSISCSMGGIYVPIEVSTFQNDNIASSFFTYHIVLDLTNLDRSINDYPMVIVNGDLEPGSYNVVDVISINGFVKYQSPDSSTFWFIRVLNNINNNFNNLRLWISDQTNALVSAFRGDTEPGDSFQDDVSQKDSELKDMAAIMDSVSKPDINNISVEVNDYVDPNILASSMSGISTVAASPIFSDVLLMAIILATAGYVLYGKR